MLNLDMRSVLHALLRPADLSGHGPLPSGRLLECDGAGVAVHADPSGRW